MTLNRAQLAVFQKVASHFHIPKARLRGMINEVSLSQGTLKFDFPDELTMELNLWFACVEGKFNLGQLMDERKFENSPIYQAYLAMNPGNTLAFYSGGGAVWLVLDWNGGRDRSDCGIFLNRMSSGYLLYIVPLASYLKTSHPLPSQ
jgi:hypothetical protein